MSDCNIPFEIQMEVIERIPDIKSVIRCRSVSKAWKSVIGSKNFVAAHTLRNQAHNHHLLIKKRDLRDGKVKYVSIVDDDDDTFPLQKVNVFVPDSVGRFWTNVSVLGSSRGLFCLYEPGKDTAVIWNPSIRKTVTIAVPDVCTSTFVGFGVCPRNLDPKLVKITYVSDSGRLGYANVRTQVEVFTLSSGGIWRSPLSSSNLPYKYIQFGYSQAVVDGFIYWFGFSLVVDRIHMDDITRKHNVFMSFDLTSEEFTKVNLPDPLELDPDASISLSNLGESLAVLQHYHIYPRREICSVWMMSGHHGCHRSFNKLYSISSPDASIHKTLGFRKSGAPIIKVKIDKDYDKHELAIYDPDSKIITNIGIHGLNGSFSVYSYKETLLLLGH